MKNNLLWKLLAVLALTALACWYLWPSANFYAKSPEKRAELIKQHPDINKQIINLGLDLQGGMRLVLEVQKSAVEHNDKDLLDRAYTVMENRINGLGVAEPVIQKQNDNRLIIELPGLSDSKKAKEVIGSTAQLEFKILREPAELLKAVQTIDATLSGKKLDSSDSTKRADSLSADSATKAAAQVAAASILTGADTGKSQSAAPATPTTGPKSISQFLSEMGNQLAVKKNDRSVVTDIFARADVKAALEHVGLGANQFLWSHSVEVNPQTKEEYYLLYYVKAKPELRGDVLKDARPGIAQGGMSAGEQIVEFEMNNDGARKFARVTGANVEKFLAIVLDSTVYSAPRIQTKISEGRGQITGNFSADEAKSLAVVLRAGALPAPVKIIGEESVGPSLGQDSIKKAELAFITGLGLVFLFIAFYYRGSGLIALFALTLNFVYLLAIMTAINATLTLPGVAGVVLTLGMAIDSNVIIFERMREELEWGKTVRSAVSEGYKRAFVTIIDANAAHLMTSAILVWLGTGPIRGFGMTMIIGCTVSLFTSIFVTRLVFDIYTDKRNVKTISI